MSGSNSEQGPEIDGDLVSLTSDNPWPGIILGMILCAVVFFFVLSRGTHDEASEYQVYADWCHKHDGIIPPGATMCQLPRAYPPQGKSI